MPVRARARGTGADGLELQQPPIPTPWFGTVPADVMGYNEVMHCMENRDRERERGRECV